jgi:hypothetical protein
MKPTDFLRKYHFIATDEFGKKIFRGRADLVIAQIFEKEGYCYGRRK